MELVLKRMTLPDTVRVNMDARTAWGIAYMLIRRNVYAKKYVGRNVYIAVQNTPDDWRWELDTIRDADVKMTMYLGELGESPNGEHLELVASGPFHVHAVVTGHRRSYATAKASVTKLHRIIRAGLEYGPFDDQTYMRYKREGGYVMSLELPEGYHQQLAYAAVCAVFDEEPEYPAAGAPVEIGDILRFARP